MLCRSQALGSVRAGPVGSVTEPCVPLNFGSHSGSGEERTTVRVSALAASRSAPRQLVEASGALCRVCSHFGRSSSWRSRAESKSRTDLGRVSWVCDQEVVEQCRPVSRWDATSRPPHRRWQGPPRPAVRMTGWLPGPCVPSNRGTMVLEALHPPGRPVLPSADFGQSRTSHTTLERPPPRPGRGRGPCPPIGAWLQRRCRLSQELVDHHLDAPEGHAELPWAYRPWAAREVRARTRPAAGAALPRHSVRAGRRAVVPWLCVPPARGRSCGSRVARRAQCKRGAPPPPPQPDRASAELFLQPIQNAGHGYFARARCPWTKASVCSECSRSPRKRTSGERPTNAVLGIFSSCGRLARLEPWGCAPCVSTRSTR